MKTNIGFAIHDAARDGRAFQIEHEDDGEALVFGTDGNVQVQARGVLAKHFVLLPYQGMLLAASSSSAAPAYLTSPSGEAGDQPLSTEWTMLDLPCRVCAGSAVIEIFVVRADLADAECTRVGPLELPVPERVAPAPALETIRTRLSDRTPRDLALLAAYRLRDDYQRLSRAKRLMVPIAGLLALLAFAQPSRADEMTPPSPAGAPSSMPLVMPQIPMGQMSLPPPSQAQPLQRVAPPQVTVTSATLAPTVRQGTLPSARSLPSEGRTQLTTSERVVYHKAIEAMLGGDFQTAYRLYDQLAQAHPDASEIRAAHRVLAGKIRGRS